MVFEKLVALIAEQLNRSVDDITEDTSFEADLNVDSLDMIEFSLAVEEEFDIEEFSEEEAAGIQTVGDLARLIQSRID